MPFVLFGDRRAETKGLTRRAAKWSIDPFQAMEAFLFLELRIGRRAADPIGSDFAVEEQRRTTPMFQLAARQLSSLRLPIDRLVGITTVAAFFWLLGQDRIHPVAIYLLELYLSL